MRVNFVFSEGAIGLRPNVTMTGAMGLTTPISLALFGAGLLLAKEVGQMKQFYADKVEVSIFLQDNVTEDQKTSLLTQLRNDPLVQSVQHESKAEADERFKVQFRDTPQLVANVKQDVLPESFRVRLKDSGKFQAVSAKSSGKTGVDQVVDQQKILGRLFKVLNGIRNSGFALALAQAIAALLLIGNTVQVAAFSRGRETGIMKLVGSSNFYVYMPFVLEAAVAGFVGSLIAIIGLGVAKIFLIDGALKSLFTSGIIPNIQWSSIALVSPILVLTAVVMAAVAAVVTLRFYVKLEGCKGTVPKESGRKFIAQNRKARHDYHIEDTVEAGIVLTGTEVKSLRAGRASLVDGYATIDGCEVWLHRIHIPEYTDGSWRKHK